MTKKLLSLAALMMLFGTVTVSAQDCIPDALYADSLPGVYPDSATNLPCALVGELYETTITVIVPEDTTAELNPGNWVTLRIDSIRVEDTSGDGEEVTGLPSTIVHACEPGSCSFPGNTSGCLKLVGIPNTGDVGVHVIVVELRAYTTYEALSLKIDTPMAPVDYYSIQVVADSSSCTGYWPLPVGLEELDKTKIGILKNVPNPFEGETNIQFMLPASTKVDFQVHNLLGSLVYTKQINGSVGLNKFVFSSKGMEPGVYLYTLNDGSSVATGRMVVSE